MFILATMTVAVWSEGSNAGSAATVAIAVDGQYIFSTKGCVACHDADAAPGGGSIGPNLTNLSEVATARVEGMAAADYVRQSIREPNAYVVPGYGKGVMPVLSLSDTEVDALVEYLLDVQP